MAVPGLFAFAYVVIGDRQMDRCNTCRALCGSTNIFRASACSGADLVALTTGVLVRV